MLEPEIAELRRVRLDKVLYRFDVLNELQFLRGKRLALGNPVLELFFSKMQQLNIVVVLCRAHERRMDRGIRRRQPAMHKGYVKGTVQLRIASCQKCPRAVLRMSDLHSQQRISNFKSNLQQSTED